MPFIPHTQDDVKKMLKKLSVDSIDALFDEIPEQLKLKKKPDFLPALNESSLSRMLQDRQDLDQVKLSFLGAGSYEHYIPAAVWSVTGRGEFLTAYTPYQAEASQGTLQLLYEYQTMMANLLAMDASNASLYDGATALAEAVLMAVRISKGKVKRILLPQTVNPLYRDVVNSIVTLQEIQCVEIPCDETGGIEKNALEEAGQMPFNALIIPQPNFFGQLEVVDSLTNWAHAHQALVIGVVNPIAMALLKAPGYWGNQGADIVCGEGQPLGVPRASGGPYFGFLCSKKEYIRQMPGRIVGRTVDQHQQVGYTLTLQAREQHIRRSKATSNICTNQGLLVTAATIYMSLLGYKGLSQVAKASYHNTRYFKNKITRIPGFSVQYNNHHFHEIVIKCPQAASKIVATCAKQKIDAGLALKPFYPSLEDTLLLCCFTETKTLKDIDDFVDVLSQFK